MANRIPRGARTVYFNAAGNYWGAAYAMPPTGGLIEPNVQTQVGDAKGALLFTGDVILSWERVDNRWLIYTSSYFPTRLSNCVYNGVGRPLSYTYEGNRLLSHGRVIRERGYTVLIPVGEFAAGDSRATFT